MFMLKRVFRVCLLFCFWSKCVCFALLCLPVCVVGCLVVCVVVCVAALWCLFRVVLCCVVLFCCGLFWRVLLLHCFNLLFMLACCSAYFSDVCLCWCVCLFVLVCVFALNCCLSGLCCSVLLCAGLVCFVCV